MDDPCYSAPGFEKTSSRVARFTHCEATGGGLSCVVRDHSAGQGDFNDPWHAMTSDAEDAMSWVAARRPFVIVTGEEINVKSADEKTIHMLEFGGGYVESSASGGAWPMECLGAFMPSVARANDLVTRLGAISYAAHPRGALSTFINGGTWQAADVEMAWRFPSFMGFELWNNRRTLKHTTQADLTPNGRGLDPFAVWHPCDTSMPF
ncbi:MAG: hypothetical protein HY904_13820 [Deltaproteobacteria bacterium]|nr:hypothetical protein [Deltaproteobacteria bacterium]